MKNLQNQKHQNINNKQIGKNHYKHFSSNPVDRDTDLVPWMGLDLRELELCVVGIHTFYFLTSWCSQDLKHNKHKQLLILSFGDQTETNHGVNIFFLLRRGYLDNFNKLINSTLTRKERLNDQKHKWSINKDSYSINSQTFFIISKIKMFYLSKKKFGKHTPHGPDVNCTSVFSCPKYQFRCTIVSRTDI